MKAGTISCGLFSAYTLSIRPITGLNSRKGDRCQSASKFKLFIMFHYLLGMMAPGNIPLPGTIPPYAGLVENVLKVT